MMTTESEIHTWIASITRNWDQACQALMWQTANRFGRVVSTPPSAIAAYDIENRAGRIRTGDPAFGAFTYWAIGSFGHVAFNMNEGRAFMTGRPDRTREQWANSNVGWNTVQGYSSVTGARYLGWSMQNGGNTIPFTADGGRQPAPERKDHTVFRVSYQGWFGIILPAENGRLFAAVLGGSDEASQLPIVSYSTQFPPSWQALRSRLVNPQDVPA